MQEKEYAAKPARLKTSFFFRLIKLAKYDSFSRDKQTVVGLSNSLRDVENPFFLRRLVRFLGAQRLRPF